VCSVGASDLYNSLGSCAAPSAKGDDKFITTDYLQQCLISSIFLRKSRPGKLTCVPFAWGVIRR
ncbi:hypothetical protein FOT69_26350, partial [Citrobacter portucalensis]|nr:hypothetical protein [Citrobacter portucalensis]